MKTKKSITSRWKASIYPIASVIIFVSLILGLIWLEINNPQGDATSSCSKGELTPIVNNHSNLIVTSHITICGMGSSMIYVYVHDKDVSENKDSLVFRFGDFDESPPEITWIDEKTLQIKVDHVWTITKQLSDISGIKISYVIKKNDNA